MAEALQAPSVVSRYAVQGLVAGVTTSAVMARIIAEEVKWMTPVAAGLNLKGD